MLHFGFATPKRHILAQKRVFWYILRRCPWWRLGCGWYLEPPKKIAESTMMREVAHARKRNHLSNLNRILQGDRYPRLNHLCKFWLKSVKGFRGGGGQSLPSSIDFDRRPYNTLALPCECVIMAALRSRCGHYIFALWFILSSSFLSHNLSGRRLDVYDTSTHSVALVRI